MTVDSALLILVIAWSGIALLASLIGLIMAILVFIKLMKRSG